MENLLHTGKDNIMSRVVLLITLMSISFIPRGFSQIFDTRGVIAPPTMTTDFLEAVHNSVNYQTGGSNFSLHLFSLKVDDNFEIPINIIYAGNGIKYSQESGEVGVGWSINSNFSVSRTIYGRPDEFFPKPASIQDVYTMLNSGKYSRDRYLTRFTFGLPTNAGLIVPNNEPLLDGEYDLFDYRTPTSSGTFGIQDVQSKTIVTSSHLTNKFDFEATAGDGIRSFTIKEGNGNVVTCGYDLKRGGYLSNYMPTYLVSKAGIQWPVNKVVTPNNKSVEFSYIFRNISEGKLPVDRAVTITEARYEPTLPIPEQTAANDINDGTSPGGNVYLTDSIISQYGCIKIYRNPSISASDIDSIALFDNTGKLVNKVVFYKSYTLGFMFLDKIAIVGDGTEPPLVYTFDYQSRDNSLNLTADIWDHFMMSPVARASEKHYPQEITNEVIGQKLDMTQVDPLPVRAYQYIGSGIDRSPQGTPDILALKKVTFPTGGTMTYSYGPNYFETQSGLKQGPGIRVESISKYDPVAHITENHNYVYEGGTIPVDVTSNMYALYQQMLYPVPDQSSVPDYYAAPFKTFSNNPISENDPYFTRFNTVSYSTVKDASSNGSVIYHFNNATQGMWATPDKYGNGFFYSYDLYNNANVSMIEYLDIQNNVKKIQKNDFGRGQGPLLLGIKIKPYAFFYNGFFNPAAWNNAYSYQVDGLYNYTTYNVTFDQTNMYSTSVFNYEDNSIWTVKDLTYNSYGQVVSETDTLSDKSVRTVIYTYANNYPNLVPSSVDEIANDILKMQQANILDQWIEKITWIKKGGDEYVSEAQFQTMLPFSNKSRTVFNFINSQKVLFQSARVINGKVKLDNNYLPSRQTLLQVDEYGNAIALKDEKSLPTGMIWGYKSTIPIAVVKCSTVSDLNKIAFTSFEPEGKGNWSFNGTPVLDANAIAGRYSYSINSGVIQKSDLLSDQTYIVSYWSKNKSPYTISGGTNTVSVGKTIRDWTLYVHKVTGATNISISGSGSIDELRLHPANAQMTTCTYAPLVGITSSSDAGNRIAYYEYDGMQRIKRVRDQDYNIIKSYDYQFQVNSGCGPNCYSIAMQTFSANATIGYPVGVFNVEGKLLGNAADASQYVSLWNTDAADAVIGTLSTGLNSMHFNMTLNAGKTLPAGVIGCRYYQIDLPWTNIDGVRNKNAAYIDFGDGTGMKMGAGLADIPSIVAPNTIYKTQIEGNLDGFARQAYFKHSYPDNSLKTLTFYHNDAMEFPDFDNVFGDAYGLSKLRNLRGNLPLNTPQVGGSSYQDSSMSSIAQITNWNDIHGVTNFRMNDGDALHPWLNIGFTQDFMAANPNLGYIQTVRSSRYPAYYDPSFKLSRLKSDWNTYFTKLHYIRIHDDHWNHENLTALTKLDHFILYANTQDHMGSLSPTGSPWVPILSSVIDNIINQIAAGAGQTVTNGVILINSAGGNRTSASDDAVQLLLSKGWTITINTDAIPPA